MHIQSAPPCPQAGDSVDRFGFIASGEGENDNYITGSPTPTTYTAIIPSTPTNTT